MRYVSTRSTSGVAEASFSDILLAGLADDGGLFLPQFYPQVDEATLEEWRGVLEVDGYAALAKCVLALFIDDIPDADLAAITERAYASGRFSDPAVVPVSPLLDGRLWLAHTSLGPTAAFKDLAMALLGELFEYELGRRGDWLTIVGATSGDTGSAAEAALRGRSGIKVFMLTPAGRMTPFQQAQMFGIDDPNIVNVAVAGVFDDCQDLVKQVNGDAEFKARWHIGAVNSINWARLVAQLVYYVASWLQVTTGPGQEVSFVVPSGNFGNICAAHIARQMGLPIADLVVATNENNVLEEFFRTGVYRVRPAAETLATSSPSMDISKASNFERFVYDLLGRDGARVADLFGRQLGTQGYFDLSDTEEFATLRERFGFLAARSTHADRVATIKRLWEASGTLIDPHTADGVHVAEGLLDKLRGEVVVMETALPVKFAETITEAIGQEPARPTQFEGIEDLPRHVVDLPNDVVALRELIESRAGE